LRTDQVEVEAMAEHLTREQSDFMHEIARAQEEVSLAAIELLQAIGSPPAFTALQQHLPFASPRLTAAALRALATIGGAATASILRPYLRDPHPQVRMAAIAGLHHVEGPALRQAIPPLLDDPDVQVRAAALAVALADPAAPDYPPAYRAWEAMLASPEEATQVAALSIMATVPHSALQGHLYRALHHAALHVRYAALRVLHHLATTGNIQEIDAALLRALEDDDLETRELALQVVAAIGTDMALEHLLVLLDDEQPRVREALVRATKPFGKRAIAPLIAQLQSPQATLLAKETALLALARLEGIHPDQLLPFWEGALREVYQYKLMLACLETHAGLPADTFLRAALRTVHDQMLSLLIQLLAVWASPEVARLVEGGLHDADRYKRAHALEALESLSERRFTRLFLPILAASEDRSQTWREVAQHQWHLTYTEVAAVLDTCVQSANKWLVIGALLSIQARSTTLGPAWTERLQRFAESAAATEVRSTARRLLDSQGDTHHRPLALTEVMLFLQRVPLYSSLSLDQLHTITTHLTEHEASAGGGIFREGDESHELYLIVSGAIKISKKLGGVEQTLVTLSAGGFFGDMAIFENRPRSATAVATEDSILLVLRPEHFRQIILQEPAISFEIFRELSARLRRFDQETVTTAS
jgi:CRP-like cAMP-binding protein/HEAT repeat protein